MKKQYNLFYFLFAAALFFLSASSLKKEIICSKFKKGKFIYNFRERQKSIQILIERDDFTQTETDLSTGDHIKLKVKWISECVYELKFNEHNMSYPDSIEKPQKSIVLRNEIIAITNDYYIFKSQTLNGDFQLIDTAWVKK
jgi:hypothetical protein